jgi:hypothetical protein
MEVDKMTVDKMTVDKMTVDKMTVDKMTVNKMTVDKMTVDKMTVGMLDIVKITYHRFPVRKLEPKCLGKQQKINSLVIKAIIPQKYLWHVLEIYLWLSFALTTLVNNGFFSATFT